jgi:hypothetical protein
MAFLEGGITFVDFMLGLTITILREAIPVGLAMYLGVRLAFRSVGRVQGGEKIRTEEIRKALLELTRTGRVPEDSK